jgi:ATP/maltotriose-dependent transcriptional regulator MalT
VSEIELSAGENHISMSSKSRKTSALQDKLRQGRESYRCRAWGDAYRTLSLADQKAPLRVEDLELLATAAYMTGRDLEFWRILDRAHHAHLETGNHPRAARCAFWSGLTLLLRGEAGQAGAWFARAQRLVDGRDCVEQGYLLLPVAELQLGEGHDNAAHTAAERAAEIGERFADADLIACARHLLGRAQLRQGRLQAGLALLDEAMLAAVAGELSPIMTGLIYCSRIEACRQVFALSRAHEWTSALSRWCDQQKEMVAFTGTCLVHRAEIMQLQGAWSDAMAEADRACKPISHAGVDRTPSAAAFYQKAEMHRLRGQVEAAEEAYRTASRLGREPQPGLALLRMHQGRTDAASAAIRRVVGTATDPLERVRLLPAHVEILLATGDIEEARSACRDLEEIAGRFGTDILQAMAAQARGAVALAEGEARTALAPLRRAFEVWQAADAPYEAARVRVLMGLACHSIGDEEAGELEIAAARAVFEQLGAGPEIARLDALSKAPPSVRERGLTRRELQILRLIASGKTNKAIAAELFLSERTIDRHVSNIFCKLDVPSRAAAIAYAYGHKLL